MSLGLALIGIVGALFFRREPEVSKEQTPPPVENLDQLDKELAEQGKGPYDQKIDDLDTPAPLPNAKQISERKSGKKDAKSRDTAHGPGIANHDSVDSLGVDDALAEETPVHNREWEPSGPSATPGTKATGPSLRTTGTASGNGRTHVIQAGDTLSSLAARYLGSASRYHEIFEANRSQLRSPNDVREGMTLKIPDGGKARETVHTDDADNTLGPAASFPGHVTRTKSNSKPKAQPVTRSRSIPANEDSEDDADDAPPADPALRSKLRFVPVHGSPFSAGRTK
ncbi:MAG: LysM peptidoglycan-binding domain-containing protein [Planctomycetes bacterium]|nr:LysM peptidoglycan-binding domain-containing protein [Planctomycetota bacterium]